MKDIISIRIPSICICFTLVTVANSALNLLHSGGTDMYAISILLIFVWLVLCQLIDAAICRIDFKKMDPLLHHGIPHPLSGHVGFLPRLLLAFLYRKGS